MALFASLGQVPGGGRRETGVRSMRRTLLLASLLVVVAGAAAPARGHDARRSTSTGTATFVITGHGWGHGVGMSQYGAYGYAQHGFAYTKIVAHYFPGTQLGPAPLAKVRVLLGSGASTLKIGSADDFAVRDGGGVSHDVAAGAYTLTPGLKLRLLGDPKPTALPGPLLFQPGASPLALQRRYRGAVQVDVADGKLRTINIVGLEHYLYGVVPSEMPYSWSPEALKAQAVVARSYALAVKKSGPFDLYPDTRSQMYLGLDHEKPSSNAAVDATAGKVLLYNGQVAKTYFYSTSGGRTASAQDVWGSAIPYLVSVPDPYDTISPYHDWGPFAFTGAGLARVLHLGGRVTDLQPVVNSSGRVQSLTVDGALGSVAIKADDLRRRLNLRSTWFTVGVLALGPPDKPVVYGSQVRLGGVARGLADVTLQQRAGASWEPAAQVSADKNGSVSVLVKPAVSTLYRLASGKVAAGAVRVAVAPLVRFYAPRAPDSLRGVMRPAVPGAAVQLQRQQGTAWTTAARTTVDANGDFVARLQLTTGTYRARVVPGHGFVPGLTPVLQVSTS